MTILELIDVRINQKKQIDLFLEKNRKMLIQIELLDFFKTLPFNRQLEFISNWKAIQDKYNSTKS